MTMLDSVIQETVTRPPATMAEQLERTFPFTVTKQPLTGPDNAQTPHYGLFRSDTGECVGNAVRRGYTPHTLDDVSALCEAASAAFDGECQLRGAWNDGHFVSIVPSDEYRRSIFGTSDNIFPRLIVNAGYDGRAFQASLGYYRDVCRNLAMLRSEGRTAGDSIKHTFGLRERIGDLIVLFRRIAGRWDQTVEQAREMETRQLDLAHFLREVYPLPDDASRRTITTHDKRVEKIVRRVIRERQETGRPELSRENPKVSAWEAFNAIQGYVQHEARRNGNPDTMQRAILALRDSAVSRAMDLAAA